MTAEPAAEILAAPLPLPRTHHEVVTRHTPIGAALGPVTGILIWSLPLGLDPTVQKAFAIVGFMIVYWITEAMDHAITALIGCYLFWAFHVANFSVAFSGFASSTPWFLFGAMLMGEAASRSGLAKRLGYMVMHRIGTSYSRLLLGIITLSFLLNFLIPSGMARVAVIAPMIIGIAALFDLGPRSNVAKGLFLILSYTSCLFDKMILSGAASILTRGIIEEQTGLQVLWSQWFVAFLPATLIIIFACWFTVRWLYPGEKKELPGGSKYLQESLKEMGPWTLNEKKAMIWLLLAISLWASDFLHHTNPAVIALGIGLFLTLPKVGVLDTKAVKQVNLLLIVFSAGALGMGNVLMQTKGLNLLTDSLVRWIEPLSDAFHATITLYWGGFLYHFFLANGQSMLATSLPVLLQLAEAQGYNPIPLGLIWTFAAGGSVFVYQSGILVLAYSYGYFEGRDLVKVGVVLTIVQGILLMVLVPVYWPLIGLNWVQ